MRPAEPRSVCCSTRHLPLAIEAPEKGYIASAPDSLGRCAEAVKVDRTRAIRAVSALVALVNNQVTHLSKHVFFLPFGPFSAPLSVLVRRTHAGSLLYLNML